MSIISTTAWVLIDKTVNRLVSPMSVTTEHTEVSLNSAMKSFTTGGMTIRTAWGTITRKIAWVGDIPNDSAASICPPGMAWMPAR